MPRIDQVGVVKGKFKKTKVRSWDDDLINSLKITDEASSKTIETPNNTYNKELNKSSKDKSELKFNKGSSPNSIENPVIVAASKKEPLVNDNSKLGLNKSSNDKYELGFNKGSSPNSIENPVIVAASKKEPLVNDNSMLGFNKSSNDKYELGFNKSSSPNSIEKPVIVTASKKESLVNDFSKLELNEGQNSAINLASDTPSFLDDDFRYTKIIKRLSGHELTILIVLLKICLRKDSLKTGSISSEDFDTYTRITRNSRETAIKRLCKKGIIKRLTGKRGIRGTINIGFANEMVYRITKDLHQLGDLNVLELI